MPTENRSSTIEQHNHIEGIIDMVSVPRELLERHDLGKNTATALAAHKGDPARPAEECPDGQRYKAIGNSKAVPVVRWIGRRLKQHLERRL